MEIMERRKIWGIVFALVAVGFIVAIAMTTDVSAPSGGGTALPPKPERIAATFTCADGKSIDAVFYPSNDTRVDLTLSDGRTLTVPHAISASGARYATPDESFVFWNKGDTAFIDENGATTYQDCMTKTVN